MKRRGSQHIVEEDVRLAALAATGVVEPGAPHAHLPLLLLLLVLLLRRALLALACCGWRRLRHRAVAAAAAASAALLLHHRLVAVVAERDAELRVRVHLRALEERVAADRALLQQRARPGVVAALPHARRQPAATLRLVPELLPPRARQLRLGKPSASAEPALALGRRVARKGLLIGRPRSARARTRVGEEARQLGGPPPLLLLLPLPLRRKLVHLERLLVPQQRRQPADLLRPLHLVHLLERPGVGGAAEAGGPPGEPRRARRLLLPVLRLERTPLVQLRVRRAHPAKRLRPRPVSAASAAAAAAAAAAASAAGRKGKCRSRAALFAPRRGVCGGRLLRGAALAEPAVGVCGGGRPLKLEDRHARRLGGKGGGHGLSLGCPSAAPRLSLGCLSAASRLSLGRLSPRARLRARPPARAPRHTPHATRQPPQQAPRPPPPQPPASTPRRPPQTTPRRPPARYPPEGQPPPRRTPSPPCRAASARR